jgi:hypothetical protein
MSAEERLLSEVSDDPEHHHVEADHGGRRE